MSGHFQPNSLVVGFLCAYGFPMHVSLKHRKSHARVIVGDLVMSADFS